MRRIQLQSIRNKPVITEHPFRCQIAKQYVSYAQVTRGISQQAKTDMNHNAVEHNTRGMFVQFLGKFEVMFNQLMYQNDMNINLLIYFIGNENIHIEDHSTKNKSLECERPGISPPGNRGLPQRRRTRHRLAVRDSFYRQKHS